MKKFPSILQDKNNDDISNVVNSISDNRRCKLKSIKNVVELPDVWKRTNSYISSKNSKSTSINTATTTINDEYKLSFDFSLSNNRHNNNNNHSQLSLVKNNNKIGLAGLGLNNSPSSSTKVNDSLLGPETHLPVYLQRIY